MGSGVTPMRQMYHVIITSFLLIAVVKESAASAPDTCTTTFDAAARIRGELFFFKDHYFWRLNRHDQLLTRDPVPLDTFWKGLNLPSSQHIDAAYERADGTVVFFSGRYYWLVWERHALSGYPRPLSELGLPEETPGIDGAFVSRYTGGTYLFTGDHYWRFNEKTRRVELDYPRPLGVWCRGLPSRLDAAFHHSDGDAYFIQGQHYWRCDPRRGVVRGYAPDLVTPRWFGCSLVQCCLHQLADATDSRVKDVMGGVWTEGGELRAGRKVGGGSGGGRAGGEAAVAAAAALLAVLFAL